MSKKGRYTPLVAMEVAPTGDDLKRTLRQTLNDKFGHSDYRGQQEQIILSVCEKKDTLAILPTGAGKSLLYQLPALVLPGMALVVSPLISLMENQMNGLRAMGITQAACLHSGIPRAQRLAIEADLKSTTPKTKLLFVTPEKLVASRSFVMRLTELRRAGLLSFVAVDEAHCCSQWGHEFRPNYLELGGILKGELEGISILAVTATATEKVKRDVLLLLGMDEHKLFLQSFNRPNIHYNVRYFAEESVYADLLAWIKSSGRAAQTGIVYCRSRAKCDSYAERFQADGLSAAAYHSGLPVAQKSDTLTQWEAGDVLLVVATISFGMGVNKENVRYVAHTTLPHTVEAFYQESGRAGRDGNAAHSLLYYSTREADSCKYLIGKDMKSEDDKMVKLPRALTQLKAMMDLCIVPSCRRVKILAHFGQKTAPVQKGFACCDFCDNPAAVERLIRDELNGVSQAPKIQRISRKRSADPDKPPVAVAEDLGQGTAGEQARNKLQLRKNKSRVVVNIPKVPVSLRKPATLKIQKALASNLLDNQVSEFPGGVNALKFAMTLETDLFRKFQNQKPIYSHKVIALVKDIQSCQGKLYEAQVPPPKRVKRTTSNPPESGFKFASQL